MVDGTYGVILKTPMGVKKGDLVLKSESDVLTGAMIVMGQENPIAAGTVTGDSFTFTGELKTAVGKVPFECSGTVTGDEITGTAKTKKGNLAMTGKRK